MKAKALKGFTGWIGGNSISVSEGQIVDVPAGTDWVKAGLVEPLPGEVEERPTKKAPETAAVQPPEDAAVPAGQPRDGVLSTESLKPTKGKKGK